MCSSYNCTFLFIYSLSVIYNFTHIPLSHRHESKTLTYLYSLCELLWKWNEWKVVRNDGVCFKEQEGEGWKRGLDGRVGDRGARGRENSESLCWYTRHWETHSRHINAFTRWHERAHKRMLLPTATQTRAGIPEGSTSLSNIQPKWH